MCLIVLGMLLKFIPFGDLKECLFSSSPLAASLFGFTLPSRLWQLLGSVLYSLLHPQKQLQLIHSQRPQLKFDMLPQELS